MIPCVQCNRLKDLLEEKTLNNNSYLARILPHALSDKSATNYWLDLFNFQAQLACQSLLKYFLPSGIVLGFKWPPKPYFNVILADDIRCAVYTLSEFM